MRRFIPDTFAGRTIMVLLIGFMFSHGLSMVFYVTDRTVALDLVGGEHLAERIITIARLIENAPATERKGLARLADGPALTVSLDSASALDPRQRDDWQTDLLRRSFVHHLSRLGERDLTLRYGAPSSYELSKGASYSLVQPDDGTNRLLRVSLRTMDGSWLNFNAIVEPVESIWTNRFILSMAVMAIAVILISVIIVHYLNRPLRLFTAAAQRLGRDMHAPPLLEVGPREVRQAAQAFNEMQMRIRRLIDDRTQMLTAIAHDLRTPITLLRLRAEFHPDGEERARNLATLDDMENMVASILRFARNDAESEEPRLVDLTALVGSICDDMADAGLLVEFEGAERLPCECRDSSIKRALTNIVDNAVKYGGKAHVRLTGSADAVTVFIEDEGPGLPEEEMEKVFSPFYRVERSRTAETSGTGLGMTVARTIIVAHGGDVTLENRDEGGLRVAVTLPR